jgi:hypothetical protein
MLSERGEEVEEKGVEKRKLAKVARVEEMKRKQSKVLSTKKNSGLWRQRSMSNRLRRRRNFVEESKSRVRVSGSSSAPVERSLVLRPMYPRRRPVVSGRTAGSAGGGGGTFDSWFLLPPARNDCCF